MTLHVVDRNISLMAADWTFTFVEFPVDNLYKCRGCFPHDAEETGRTHPSRVGYH